MTTKRTRVYRALTCHACFAFVLRTWAGRRVVRAGRERRATVQRRFCRDCAVRLLGLWLPVGHIAPLSDREVESLRRRAQEPDRGGAYFKPGDVLRLIATLDRLRPVQGEMWR